jgi:hypothetical protein
MTLNEGSPGQENDIPEDYVPYKNVSLCGNMLMNVRFLVEIRKTLHPFLIGKGKIPYIWVSAPTAPGQQVQQWSRIIERSTAKVPSVDIEVRASEGMMGIRINGKTLLSVSKFDEDSITVSEIDLRLIGLTLFGSNNQLTVGNSQYTSSALMGFRAFLVIN